MKVRLRAGPFPARGVAPLAALALVAGACGYDITTQQAQGGAAVATYHAPGADFAAYRTFAIVSKVGLVADGSGTPSLESPGVLALIASTLEARGFQRTAEIDPQNPPSTPPAADLAVNVTALEATGTDPAYWSGYAGHAAPQSFGYPGYAWRYPWDWVPIASRTGTLLVEIGDLKSAMPVGGTAGGRIVVLWASLAYGVSAGNAVYDTSPVFDSIDRAFAQSADLRTQ